MALGRNRPKQGSLFVDPEELARSPGHPFYRKLSALLRDANFDRFVEDLCASFYNEKRGRPSIPPGVYFRMLLIGYFEKLESQRAIAWRCSDSLSLREFLGLGPTERSPDHSSLTVIRQRLSEEVFEQVFAFILGLLVEHGLVKGKTLAVDSTTLEANAAMKSIVRRDTGENWREYLRRLTIAEGEMKEPTDEDVRRFDRSRKGKKTSNRDWKSPTDPDAQIMRMKDGRTRLGYKAEHTVDLEHGALVDVAVHPATAPDSDTLIEAVVRGQTNLLRAGAVDHVTEIVADKGYHKAASLAVCDHLGVRTYIPEPRSRRRVWKDKHELLRQAVYTNRRRTRRAKGRRLQRKRSEIPERSFAHLYGRGGLRRTWIRGLGEVSKRTLMQGAAANLGLLMRKLFGVGTPKEWAATIRAILRILIGHRFTLGDLRRIGVMIKRETQLTFPSAWIRRGHENPV